LHTAIRNKTSYVYCGKAEKGDNWCWINNRKRTVQEINNKTANSALFATIYLQIPKVFYTKNLQP